MLENGCAIDIDSSFRVYKRELAVKKMTVGIRIKVTVVTREKRFVRSTGSSKVSEQQVIPYSSFVTD